MSKYSAYKNKFFILFKHSYETYSAVILEAPTGGYEQFNPLHMEAFGVHGSPIQFFITPKSSWIAIMALAALQEQGRWLNQSNEQTTRQTLRYTYTSNVINNSLIHLSLLLR
jgi:hypothetical protein